MIRKKEKILEHLNAAFFVYLENLRKKYVIHGKKRWTKLPVISGISSKMPSISSSLGGVSVSEDFFILATTDAILI